MTPAAVVYPISKCFIKPDHNLEASQNSYYLTPWELSMLSTNYIQRGLLFPKPPSSDELITIIDRLKTSLSQTLLHFFPLSGRLVTLKNENPPSSSIFVDCKNSPGAEFNHAAAEITIDGILSPTDVPTIVNSFFTLNGAVNHDGHILPLLSVQVTELIDGIFIGCSLSHSIADGNSFWHFINTWSEITKAQGKTIHNISRPPILKRWFVDGHGPIVDLPFSDENEFIERYVPPLLRERIFHFSSQSIAKLKEKANRECNTSNISSFQAISALIWRSITRSRQLLSDQKTVCRIEANNRPKLNPQLSQDYFGNCIQTLSVTTTVDELLGHCLGRAALMVNEAVANHTDGEICQWTETWVKNPFVYNLGKLIEPFSVHFVSSPRFDMYGNDFGWGKPVGVRSGCGNKFAGKLSAYPGREGGGSMDFEVCLEAEIMRRVESDEEFMESIL